MATPPPRPRVRWILVALLACAAVVFALNVRRAGDFAGYLLIGNLALDGRDIYRDAPVGVSTWPPLFSLLCVPLALLARPSVYLARGFWLLLNFVLLAAVLRVAARLVYGRTEGLTRAAVVVPLLLTWRPVLSNFEHLQVNVAIFALALVGLDLVRQRREIAGGLALGCAAALKVMPVLFVPYLVYRGRWGAAAYTAAVTLGLSLLPIVVYGEARYRDYVLAWLEAIRRGWGVGKMNLSVYAMWDRIIGHGLVPFAVPGINGLAPSGDPRVAVALALSLAAVTGLALWTFRAPAGDERRATLAEWSIVFIVASVFSTVAWKAYLVVQLLPNMLMYDVWRTHPEPRTRRVAGALLLATFALGGLTSDDLIGRALAWRLEMGSVVTYSALVQLAGLFWLRRNLAVLTANSPTPAEAAARQR